LRVRSVIRRSAGLSVGGFALAMLCGAAAVPAGLGSRWGIWHFRTGFQVVTWAAYGALASAVVSLVGFIGLLSIGRRQELILALVGITVGLAVAWVPWQWKQTAQRVPPIHDITTDTENPPAFVAVLPLRQDAPNSAEYGGSDIAAQQRAAYPNLGPLVLNVSPDEAFTRALTAAREMGWRIVQANADEGRIEATDTTVWFGFKDDIVVRIRPVEQGSRIDVRSVSRVGKSDVGTNARRIRAYLQKVKTQSDRS